MLNCFSRFSISLSFWCRLQCWPQIKEKLHTIPNEFSSGRISFIPFFFLNHSFTDTDKYSYCNITTRYSYIYSKGPYIPPTHTHTRSCLVKKQARHSHPQSLWNTRSFMSHSAPEVKGQCFGDNIPHQHLNFISQYHHLFTVSCSKTPSSGKMFSWYENAVLISCHIKSNTTIPCVTSWFSHGSVLWAACAECQTLQACTG